MGAIKTDRIAEICRYVEQHLDHDVGLTALAKQFGLSPHYLQKTFKAELGVTPKQYADGLRLGELKKQLKQADDVTEAIYGAGYSSASRVYERADKNLGMTPAQYRRGGKGLELSYAHCATELGILMMAATSRGLCFIQFGTDKTVLLQLLMAEFPQAELKRMDGRQQTLFDQWMEHLQSYLGGTHSALNLPVDIRGTAFQIKVWRYLQQIPYGEVRSYAEVARAIGRPKAVRAVGSACGANALALAIPCHRVIRGDGSLGGYRWGLERKQSLLDMESNRSAPVHSVQAT